MVEAPPGSKKTAGVGKRAGENPARFFSMKYIAIIFSIFIVTIVVLADLDKLGPLHRIYDFPYGDKAGHVILFGLLNYFITRAFFSSPRIQNPKKTALGVGLVLAILIAAEEWSQKYFSARTFDLLDLSASYLGLVVGGWMAVNQNP